AASRRRTLISFSLAPSKTGVAKCSPRTRAAQPRCVSRICPTFMREGTPRGFKTISTGVPSGRYGMSSSGRMRAMTPLLPWRPAILSPADRLRFIATYTLHSLRNARRRLVAAANLLLLLLELVADHFDLALGALFDLAEVFFQPRIVARHLQ